MRQKTIEENGHVKGFLCPMVKVDSCNHNYTPLLIYRPVCFELLAFRKFLMASTYVMFFRRLVYIKISQEISSCMLNERQNLQ